MKKLSVALAVTSALCASAANAAIVTEYANGAVVPWVTFSAADVTTAIGLNSCAAGDVYWTFFDVNTNHIRDGVFPMTANDQVGLTWSDPVFSGIGGLQGVDGYMTFVFDTNDDQRISLEDSTCLAANAFYVDVPANDVSYIPVFPINMAWGDFLDADGDGVGDQALGLYTSESIASLWAGARGGDVLHMRYFVDFLAGGRGTDIFIWSAPDVSGSYTVFQYDDDQNRNSIQMFLRNRELNIIDLESFDDFAGQSEFYDGFIEWIVPDDGVVSFSIVDDPSFQATQTLINPIFKPHSSNGDGIVDLDERFNVLERFNPDGRGQSDLNVTNAPPGFNPLLWGDDYGPGAD